MDIVKWVVRSIGFLEINRSIILITVVKTLCWRLGINCFAPIVSAIETDLAIIVVCVNSRNRGCSRSFIRYSKEEKDEKKSRMKRGKDEKVRLKGRKKTVREKQDEKEEGKECIFIEVLLLIKKPCAD